MKPVVLVTRKLPDSVEDRLRRDYSPILNPDDALYSGDEIIERAKGADAILPCHTEKFSAAVIARLPTSVRVIANFSVGYDHVDTEAAKARGLIVTNTPEVLSDATAELTMMLMLGAARRAVHEKDHGRPCTGPLGAKHGSSAEAVLGADVGLFSAHRRFSLYWLGELQRLGDAGFKLFGSHGRRACGVDARERSACLAPAEWAGPPSRRTARSVRRTSRSPHRSACAAD